MSLSPRTPNPMPGPGGQSCETCAMFLITDYPNGYCREESPTGETARIKVGKERPWPLCYAGDWCGRYMTVEEYLAGGSGAGGGAAAPLVEFTPTVTFGGSSQGIVLSPESVGRYQQIGEFVQCWVQVGIVDKGQGVGIVQIGGLPAGSVKPCAPLAAIPVTAAFLDTTLSYIVQGVIEDSGIVDLFRVDTRTPITDADLNPGAAFIVSGVYPWREPPAARTAERRGLFTR